MWAGGASYNFEGKGFNPTVGCIEREGTGADARQDVAARSILFSAALCCSATISNVKDLETGEEKWEPKGNSEAPIVVAAHKIGFDEHWLVRSLD